MFGMMDVLATGTSIRIVSEKNCDRQFIFYYVMLSSIYTVPSIWSTDLKNRSFLKIRKFIGVLLHFFVPNEIGPYMKGERV